MVPLSTPVMTVTNANGVYEIALEEETCVMLQQQEQEQLEKQQLREKQQLESGDTQHNYKQLLQQRQLQQQQVKDDFFIILSPSYLKRPSNALRTTIFEKV